MIRTVTVKRDDTISQICERLMGDGLDPRLWGELAALNGVVQYRVFEGDQLVIPPGWQIPLGRELHVNEGIVDLRSIYA